MLQDAGKTPLYLTEVVRVKPVSTDHSAKKVTKVLLLSVCCYLHNVKTSVITANHFFKNATGYIIKHSYIVVY